MTKVYTLIGLLAFTYSLYASEIDSANLNGGNLENKGSKYDISVDSDKNRGSNISLSMCDSIKNQSDLLSLIVENLKSDQFSYHLLDSNKMIRMSSIITEEENYIQFVPFTVGTYYLKINESHKTLMTFKIVKQ